MMGGKNSSSLCEAFLSSLPNVGELKNVVFMLRVFELIPNAWKISVLSISQIISYFDFFVS